MWFRKTSKPHCDADMALKNAQENLKQVKARDCEVKQVALESRAFRKKNHFAIDLQQLFDGGE